MTNKRDLKKYIARVANEVAEGVLPTAVYNGYVTNEQATDILQDISRLQAEALSKLNIAFDKKPDAFPSLRAYSAAKAAYYKTAYNKALSDYEEGVDKLLAPINQAKK